MKVLEITDKDGKKSISRMGEDLKLPLTSEDMDKLSDGIQVSLVVPGNAYLIRPTDLYKYQVVGELTFADDDMSFFVLASSAGEAAYLWREHMMGPSELEENDFNLTYVWEFPDELRVGVIPYEGLPDNPGAKDVTEEAKAALDQMLQSAPRP